MRARYLKPEFFRDKKMGLLEPIHALVYMAMWCMADDGGTLQCEPEWIKSEMFSRWGAVAVPDITGALRTLSALGRIEFHTVGDEMYARIVHFTEHQYTHKPSKFRYPDASKGVATTSAALLPEGCGSSAVVVGEGTPTSAVLPVSSILVSYNPSILLSETPKKAKRPAPQSAPSPDEDRVIQHYLATHPRRKAGPKEYRVVGKALAGGYSPEELCAAIDGNAADEWHREKSKHELTYVLRDDGKIGDFLAKAQPVNLPCVDANGFLLPEAYARLMRD